jgi:hypothetical protein
MNIHKIKNGKRNQKAKEIIDTTSSPKLRII